MTVTEAIIDPAAKYGRNWERGAACSGLRNLMELPSLDVGKGRNYSKRTLLVIERAKAVCDGCPVLTPCRSEALAGETERYDGTVIGGTDPFERRAIRAARRAARRAAENDSETTDVAA